ncbi:MAG: RNA methyltransferase [Deltaproteobacteria bacterium]|nr:RNA methyltransferase [Deltaproteobacteria bacterium]
MDAETRYLSQFLTPERLARIEAVLAGRTRNLALVLEDVTDPHNVAACLRSAEALGVQDVHIVAGRASFDAAHKVTQGTDKWLTMHTYRSPVACAKMLRSQGLTLAVGAPTSKAVPVHDLDFSRPVALAFCNEHEGASSELLKLADHVFYIPMLGFAQSFNISVAAAIGLYFAVSRRIKLFGTNGDLTDTEREELRTLWIYKSVPMAEAMLERYRSTEGERTEDTPKSSGEDSGEVSTGEDSGEVSTGEDSGEVSTGEDEPPTMESAELPGEEDEATQLETPPTREEKD